MDLPVPVVRRVDLLAQRRGVEDEVVRRAVQARGEPARAPGEAPRPSRRRPDRVARPKSASWRRGTIQTSNGERDANGANATVESSSQTSRSGRLGLVAHEAAPRALTFPDDEPGRAAQLLRDPVRDLGQVVQIQAEVVRPGAGLGAPVLDRPGDGRSGRSTERPRWRPCPATRRSMISLPTACSGRCSPGGATIVRQLPLARASDSATWASVPSSSRACSFVPTTWNAKSLSVRSRMPSPAGRRQFWQSPPSSTSSAGARTDRDGTPDRRRWRPTSR